MILLKQRSFWFATIVGLVLIVTIYLASTAVSRHRRNLSLADAVRKRSETDVRTLLAVGADPNAAADPHSFTWREMLQVVFQRRHPQSIKYTILMDAAQSDNDRILRMLLDAGGDVRESDLGLTALIYAISSRRHRNVEVLVQYGSDVNCPGWLGTPLIMALTCNPDPEDCAFLLAHGANPNVQSQLGETPLVQAAHVGTLKTVQLLLRAGADVNIRDADGKTALMMATENCMDSETEIVTLLLKAGADPTLVDKSGKTAEDQASANGNKPLARLLRNRRFQ